MDMPSLAVVNVFRIYCCSSASFLQNAASVSPHLPAAPPSSSSHLRPLAQHRAADVYRASDAPHATGWRLSTLSRQVIVVRFCDLPSRSPARRRAPCLIRRYSCRPAYCSRRIAPAEGTADRIATSGVNRARLIGAGLSGPWPRHAGCRSSCIIPRLKLQAPMIAELISLLSTRD